MSTETQIAASMESGGYCFYLKGHEGAHCTDDTVEGAPTSYLPHRGVIKRGSAFAQNLRLVK